MLISLPDSVVWALLVGCSAGSMLSGVVFGLWLAPWLQDWALRRAAREAERLFEKTTNRLLRAKQACELLGDASRPGAFGDRLGELEQLRLQLAESLRVILTKASSSAAAGLLAGKGMEAGDAPTFPAWQRDPVDPLTQLPDRAAFQQNLQRLVESTSRNRRPGAILLLRIDKSDQLKARYGAERFDRLASKLPPLLIQQLRDEDVVCRLSHDAFAALLPSVEAGDVLRAAEAVRQSIRTRHFRYDDDGPEILMTAGLGLTFVPPDDHPELAFERAVDAVSKAQRAGRNQLRADEAARIAAG